MKTRIFSRGKGWYIPCRRKTLVGNEWVVNTEDKATLWVNFKRDEEPAYLPPAGQDWVFIDIYVEEGEFRSANNKVNSLMVWKYRMEKPNSELTEVEKQNKEFAESIQGTAYTEKYGNRGIDLSPDDLPFY